MKTRNFFQISGLFFFIHVNGLSISEPGSSPYIKRANLDSIQIKSHIGRVIFWNVENLYDPYDDTTKLDDEFTAKGSRRWNWGRFSLKLNHVAKTLLAAGEWSPPDVVGLCEVENRYVLNKLIHETPLTRFGYRFVHHESADLRGVDVALLYRPGRFRLLSEKSYTIRFPFDTLVQTRNILMVKGYFPPDDTLVIFVTHWPSRRGGQEISSPRRRFVAGLVRSLADSVYKTNGLANILIMGDFNDEPEDPSLTDGLGAKTLLTGADTMGLFNLMGIRNRVAREGTLKFRDRWSTFDQFIVSAPMITGKGGILAGPGQAMVIRSGFLVEEDNTWFGEKMNRTYAGPRYHGGFSDHLPVLLNLLHP